MFHAAINKCRLMEVIWDIYIRIEKVFIRHHEANKAGFRDLRRSCKGNMSKEQFYNYFRSSSASVCLILKTERRA